MKTKVGAALVAAIGLVCSPVGAAADTTISGVYSFVASDFGNSLTFPFTPSPLTEISGSFGFSYTYAPDNPPISGNDPLIIPSGINLTFGQDTEECHEKIGSRGQHERDAVARHHVAFNRAGSDPA